MTAPSRTDGREFPFFFPSADGTALFGVVTEPPRAASTTILVLSGGGVHGSTQRNDLGVRICRALAAMSFRAVRIDWHGVGDSMGTVSRFHLDRPFVDDVLGAVDWLASQGHECVALVGTCFGARTALASVRQIGTVDGLYLVSLPMGPDSRTKLARLASGTTTRQLAAGRLRPSSALALLNARNRRALRAFVSGRLRVRLFGEQPERILPGSVSVRLASPVIEDLERASARGIPIDLLYGDGDEFFADFLALQSGRLGTLVKQKALRVDVTPGEVHRFSYVDAQNLVLEKTCRWASQRLEHAR